jgi:hypothetical protein
MIRIPDTRSAHRGAPSTDASCADSTGCSGQPAPTAIEMRPPFNENSAENAGAYRFAVVAIRRAGRLSGNPAFCLSEERLRHAGVMPEIQSTMCGRSIFSGKVKNLRAPAVGMDTFCSRF